MPEIERRKHPQDCLMAEEWGRIKSFVEGTKDYRISLCSKIDESRRESKEKFDAIIAQIKDMQNRLEKEQERRDSEHKDREMRIRSLERFRWMIGGAVAIVVTVLVPIAMAVFK